MIDGALKEPLTKTLLYLTNDDWYNNYWEHCLDEIKNSEAFDEKGKIVTWIFDRHPIVEFLILYFKNYLLLGYLTGANRLALEEVRNFIIDLKNPQLLGSKDYFDLTIKSLSVAVSRISPSIKNKIIKLSPQEVERLDEAIVAFSNCCYFSCTIMAVSAVESRLHSKIKKIDETLYAENFESKTLGQLLQLFNKDTNNAKYYEIKKLMPEKYYPLIQLLNQYRILSAHPKNSSIEPQIAESILNLSFAFLTDSE